MDNLADLVRSFKGSSLPAISWTGGELSYHELHNGIVDIAKGILELGYTNEQIAHVAGNYPLWLETTLAIDISRNRDVPRNIPRPEDNRPVPKDVVDTINHSDARMLIVQNKAMLDKLLKHRLANIQQIVSIEPIDGVMNINDLRVRGQKSDKELPQINDDDLACILYTSGTTADPKGVMLTHHNLASNVVATVNRVDMGPSGAKLGSKDTFAAFINPDHSYGRLNLLVPASVKSKIRVVPNKNMVLTELLATHPTMMASIPRVWGLVYTRVLEKVRKKGTIAKALFDRYVHQDIEYMISGQYSRAGYMRHAFLDKILYSELRETLGGNLKHIVSGGSSFPRHLIDFFFAAGLLITQGYGATEASPLISGSIASLKTRYTVGPLIEDTRGKIFSIEVTQQPDFDPETAIPLGKNQEGELFIKGPGVMNGYYKNEEATNAVLKNGWYGTGDLAVFDNDDVNPLNNNLLITGRAGRRFKTYDGKYIVPEHLEGLLQDADPIDTAIVLGRDWKRPGVLIYPRYDELEAFAKKRKIKYSDKEDLIHNEEVKALIKSEIDRRVNSNAQLYPWEKIGDFSIIPQLVEGVHLNQAMKVVTRRIEEDYAPQIERMNKHING